MKMTFLLAPLLFFAMPVHAASTSPKGCGGPVACILPDGEYRIELPEGGKPKGAYLFFHGYKSSALLQMKHRALVEAALKHGLAFVAVDGRDGVWSLPNLPEKGRDDPGFIRSVIADLGTRFAIMPKRMVIGGFSLGASAAWYTLCREGDRFAGAITFSGVFWDPLPKPEACTEAMPPFLHFHGRADRTFPLEGRPVGDGFHQGNTFDSLAVLRTRAACGPKRQTRAIAGIACDVAPDCNGGEIGLCVHDGGHEIDPVKLDKGLDELGF